MGAMSSFQSGVHPDSMHARTAINNMYDLSADISVPFYQIYPANIIYFDIITIFARGKTGSENKRIIFERYEKYI
jgi:hypothetical protein